VAAILDCDAAELSPDSSVTTHPKWDSFAHLDIMMALSKRFGIEIDESNIDQHSVMTAIIDLHQRSPRARS